MGASRSVRTTPLVDDRGGADFVEMIVLIGIFCLVVGAAVLLLRNTIFDTFRSAARTTQEESSGR